MAEIKEQFLGTPEDLRPLISNALSKISSYQTKKLAAGQVDCEMMTLLSDLSVDIVQAETRRTLNMFIKGLQQMNFSSPDVEKVKASISVETIRTNLGSSLPEAFAESLNVETIEDTDSADKLTELISSEVASKVKSAVSNVKKLSPTESREIEAVFVDGAVSNAGVLHRMVKHCAKMLQCAFCKPKVRGHRSKVERKRSSVFVSAPARTLDSTSVITEVVSEILEKRAAEISVALCGKSREASCKASSSDGDAVKSFDCAKDIAKDIAKSFDSAADISRSFDSDLDIAKSFESVKDVPQTFDGTKDGNNPFDSDTDFTVSLDSIKDIVKSFDSPADDPRKSFDSVRAFSKISDSARIVAEDFRKLANGFKNTSFDSAADMAKSLGSTLATSKSFGSSTDISKTFESKSDANPELKHRDLNDSIKISKFFAKCFAESLIRSMMAKLQAKFTEPVTVTVPRRRDGAPLRVLPDMEVSSSEFDGTYELVKQTLSLAMSKEAMRAMCESVGKMVERVFVEVEDEFGEEACTNRLVGQHFERAAHNPYSRLLKELSALIFHALTHGQIEQSLCDNIIKKRSEFVLQTICLATQDTAKRFLQGCALFMESMASNETSLVHVAMNDIKKIVADIQSDCAAAETELAPWFPIDVRDVGLQSAASGLTGAGTGPGPGSGSSPQLAALPELTGDRKRELIIAVLSNLLLQINNHSKSLKMTSVDFVNIMNLLSARISAQIRDSAVTVNPKRPMVKKISKAVFKALCKEHSVDIMMAKMFINDSAFNRTIVSTVSALLTEPKFSITSFCRNIFGKVT